MTPMKAIYFAPYLDRSPRHTDGCGLAWSDHDLLRADCQLPFGCPPDAKQRRINELTDLLGDASACGDPDCGCKSALGEAREELAELSA